MKVWMDDCLLIVPRIVQNGVPRERGENWIGALALTGAADVLPQSSFGFSFVVVVSHAIRPVSCCFDDRSSS
jgi:hypothetical protein